MGNRRSFIKKSAVLFSLSAIPELINNEEVKAAVIRVQHLEPAEVAQDEAFWASIKTAYTTSSTIINLNNGGVSPSPKVVQDAMTRYSQLANEAPSYYMWQILDKGRENLRKKLADLAGCDHNEIAINRNSTEALDNIIFGLNFEKGDEVILTKQDYPNMINAWKQREKRDGIKLKWVNLDLPTDDENYLINKYTEQISSRTKLVQVNHIINWNGHINPVRKIADAIHARGPEVMIDGAHSFGHFDFNIPDLGGDYFGTSLHKWLSATIGSGMLWIKKDKIKNVWPLMGAPETTDVNDIRKFENLGTRNFPIEYSIATAIDFHNMIGPERKEARLRYLKDYWVNKCIDLPKFKLNTSMNKNYSCAIANFAIDGMEPGDVATKLFAEQGVHSVSIVWENIIGVRIAPHVYTSLYDLDMLIKGIRSMAV